MRHPTKLTHKTVQVGDLDVFYRETGNFALETNGAEIATLMRDFLARH